MLIGTKQAYDFAAGKRRYAKYTMAQLRFAVEDIKQVTKVWPDHPNANWYADDLHTVVAEILRRTDSGACPTCGRV